MSESTKQLIAIVLWVCGVISGFFAGMVEAHNQARHYHASGVFDGKRVWLGRDYWRALAEDKDPIEALRLQEELTDQ